MTTLLAMPDGRLRGIYTEAVDLCALGTLDVQRATAIEFDGRLQAWRVFDPAGDCLFCAPTRQRCLEWEHLHLTRILEEA